MAVQLEVNEALDMWRRVVVTSVSRDTPDLSSRQMAVLLTVYFTGEAQTVRGLSEALGISKPAVTRALDRLSQLGLLRRKSDEADRRSILVQRTVKGSVFLRELGDIMVDAAAHADAGKAV